MKEYIFEVDDIWDDEDEVFYGWIRHHSKQLIRCKDCQEWNRKDGMFKDIDGRQWHHCECLGIDTDAWFYCREAERKEE